MTPTIAASYGECTVEFYYHMYGSHVGLLYVQLQPAGDAQGKGFICICLIFHGNACLLWSAFIAYSINSSYS